MKFDNIKNKAGNVANKVKSRMPQKSRPKEWDIVVRHNGKDVFSMRTKTVGKVAKTASTVKEKFSPKKG